MDEDEISIPLEPTVYRRRVAPDGGNSGDGPGPEAEELERGLRMYLYEVAAKLNAHFPTLGVRRSEQLYVDMIADCIALDTDVYWIALEHPYWRGIAPTHGEDAYKSSA